MFWDESQFPLAIFILKGVKCLCKFHQVTCWCFSSSRCSSWNVPHEGTIRGSMSALGGSSEWGRSWRYQLRRRLMEAVLHQWLPACPWHSDLALQNDFLLLCFQRCPWYQSSSSFSSLFPCLYHWVQLGAKGQHKIRGAWPTQGSFDFWFQEEAELDEKQFPTWNFLFGSWEGC